MKTPKLIRVMIRNKVMIGLLSPNECVRGNGESVSSKTSGSLLHLCFLLLPCDLLKPCKVSLLGRHKSPHREELTIWELLTTIQPQTYERAQPLSAEPPSQPTSNDGCNTDPARTHRTIQLTYRLLNNKNGIATLCISKSQIPDHMMIGGLVSDKEE